MNNLFPPLGTDDVPETRIDGQHHVGCIISQRRAIMGAEPMEDLRHGQFLEMAATLHAAVDGGRKRAEVAEKELAEIKAASEDWMEETGTAYAYVGIRDYAAVNERLQKAELLLTALWRYGNLHQVEGVIYPETGSHKQTLDAVNEYLFQRAIEKEKGNA